MTAAIETLTTVQPRETAHECRLGSLPNRGSRTIVNHAANGKSRMNRPSGGSESGVQMTGVRNVMNVIRLVTIGPTSWNRAQPIPHVITKACMLKISSANAGRARSVTGDKGTPAQSAKGR